MLMFKENPKRKCLKLSLDFCGKLEKSSTRHDNDASEINVQQGTMTAHSWDIGAELLCAPTECNVAVSITKLSASCLDHSLTLRARTIFTTLPSKQGSGFMGQRMGRKICLYATVPQYFSTVLSLLEQQ